MSGKQFEFQAEIKQLLDIVVHSLYSNREIFLRELISNASDALDKRRFLALTNKDIEESDLHIRIVPNKDANTLMISDNGIGMSEEELIENIGTIAHSGTRAFLDAMKESKKADNPELIGQFGVGFYSSFMVADKVSLVTKRADSDKAYRWESDGSGSYLIEETEKSGPGTDITLHLKKFDDDDDGETDFTSEWSLRSMIRKYSDFVTYPVKMRVTREEPKGEKKEGEEQEMEKVEKDETLNSMKAIWQRPKSEVKDEEYNEFYKSTTHDYTDPMEVIPFSAEGTLEYKALLFIPGRRPFDLMYRDSRRGLDLYVKKVFIKANCEELLPDWLRFVRGLVDSPDLSLNISREMVQQDRQITAIRKRLTKKVTETLRDMMNSDRNKYVKFWKEFGEVVKEGILDHASADSIKEITLFRSTAGDELTNLDEYISRMPESQKDIYFITGEKLDSLKESPLLEGFRDKNYEVLLLTDRVDEVLGQSLNEYKEKKIVHVNKGDIDLKSEEEKKEAEEKEKQDKENFGSVLEAIKESLKDDVKEVRLSGRLTNSASCLVSDEGDMTSQMEQMLAAMGQSPGASKKILELNPRHGVMEIMKKLYDADPKNPKIADYSSLLLQQAQMAEGIPVKNPVEFARKVANLMVQAGG